MNDREKEIFKIIIDHYINNGESVGSRTLEKKYSMGISSATIRNVMSDLEEMGLITKTHTSSGRIPTLQGYKTYIEELLKINDINEDIKRQIYNVYEKRINRTDIIFNETSKLLSEISNCISIVLEPTSSEELIKKIQFIKINEKNVFVVAIMKNNIVKTSVLSMNTYISEENINVLNENINNLIKTTHKNFNLLDLEKFLKTIGESESNFEDKYINNEKIFIEGIENLLSNEFENLDDIINILKTINNEEIMKNIFKELAQKVEYDTTKTHIVFGNDVEYEQLKDFVYIFKCYEFGDEIGVIGIIGPKRINYPDIIACLDIISDMLKKGLNQTKDKIYLEYK